MKLTEQFSISQVPLNFLPVEMVHNEQSEYLAHAILISNSLHHTLSSNVPQDINIPSSFSEIYQKVLQKEIEYSPDDRN